MKYLILSWMLFAFGVQAQVINEEKSMVKFELSNMGIRTVEGTIKGMKGKIVLNEDNLKNATIEASVDVNTINTENKKRDDHLKNEDFFEVEKYSTIKFISSEVVADEDSFIAIGTLTLKGVSKKVNIPFQINRSEGKRILEGSLTINRKDYQVGVDYGNFMVGEEVDLLIICALN